MFLSVTAITAGEVLSQTVSASVEPLSDGDVRTACRKCGQAQSLAEGAKTRAGVEIDYKCCRCGATVLVVGVPDKRAWPGRGYRLGDFTIRNPSDVYISPRDKVTGQQTPKGVFLPRSPYALAKHRKKPRKAKRGAWAAQSPELGRW